MGRRTSPHAANTLVREWQVVWERRWIFSALNWRTAPWWSGMWRTRMKAAIAVCLTPILKELWQAEPASDFTVKPHGTIDNRVKRLFARFSLHLKTAKSASHPRVFPCRAAPTAPSCQSVGLSCRVSCVVFGHRSTCSHCNSDCLTTTPQLLALQHRQCEEHQRYSHCQHYSCAVRFPWRQRSGWMCDASALWSSERGVCDDSWAQTDVCWW